MIVVREQPRSANLVTLGKLKRSLGITSSTEDVRLTELIEDVSSAVTEHCGREFARARVTEQLPSYAHTTLSLSRTPLLQVDEVRYLDDAISPSGYYISNPEAGFLYNPGSWASSQVYDSWLHVERVSMPGRHDYAVDYVGGYLMPDDELLMVQCSGIGSHLLAMVDSALDKFPILLSGELLNIEGFTSAAYNRRYTVIERSASGITVLEEIPNEQVDLLISAKVRGNALMPADLERIAIHEIKDRYFSEQRDATVTSESIGDWSEQRSASPYLDKDGSGLSLKTAQALRRWIRVM